MGPDIFGGRICLRSVGALCSSLAVRCLCCHLFLPKSEIPHFILSLWLGSFLFALLPCFCLPPSLALCLTAASLNQHGFVWKWSVCSVFQGVSLTRLCTLSRITTVCKAFESGTSAAFSTAWAKHGLLVPFDVDLDDTYCTFLSGSNIIVFVFKFWNEGTAFGNNSKYSCF